MEWRLWVALVLVGLWSLWVIVSLPYRRTSAEEAKAKIGFIGAISHGFWVALLSIATAIVLGRRASEWGYVARQLSFWGSLFVSGPIWGILIGLIMPIPVGILTAIFRPR